MYAKGLGITNVATGIALFTPAHNRVLFIVGASLLVSGLVIMAVSFVLNHKQVAAK